MTTDMKAKQTQRDDDDDDEIKEREKSWLLLCVGD